MKLNIMKKMAMLLILLSMGMIMAGCKSESSDDRNVDTALLYLANTPAAPDDNQTICLTAYTLANSCVTGTVQLFNPGRGCAQATLSALPAANGTITEQMTALRECVRKAVNDPIQPCNLPQFSSATAGQVVSGYIKAKCDAADVTIAPATTATKVNLTGLLIY
ncbi:hypothetical protein EHQ58_06040 [Leptospira ognonensis]|uniref:Lipoprotein n=1 Tax=Leptospira ognonensis TaxID=2484945 RepID=A0A4R9K670_9LEPT|nr:hypothetical protein [Leptospira ognonensis]TGL60057.1 hypothetical protein EHQ58_06040 [Leptospira ognonensis]